MLHRSYSRLDLHASIEPGIQTWPADPQRSSCSIVFGVSDYVFVDYVSTASIEATAISIGVYQRRIDSFPFFAFSLWERQFARNRMFLRKRFQHSL
jgi:hypothetical protein